MALVFNGTTQSGSRAKGSGVNLQTDLWAVFVWHKRDGFSSNAHVCGVARSTSFARRCGVEIRDSGGIVGSRTFYGGASDEYFGTMPFPDDEWVPCLLIKDTASSNTYVTHVGENSNSSSNGYSDEYDVFVVGGSYSGGNVDRRAKGKFAHLAIWVGSIPDATTISQLKAGMIPSETDVPPTLYDPLISSNTLLTLVGSPEFDSDDPIAPAGPEITAVNGDDTVRDASSGNTVTTSLGLDSVSAIVIRDADLNETVGSSIAGSDTSWTFATPALGDRSAAYYGSATLVLTGVYDSDPVELEFPITFNQPSGLDLTTLAADPDTSDQAVGYGIVTIAEGGQYVFDNTEAEIFDDALGYTIGDQSTQVAYVYNGTMTIFTLETGEEEEPVDDTPTDFDFNDVEDADLDEVYISNEIEIEGLGESVSSTVYIGEVGSYRVNGGDWVSDGDTLESVSNGDTLEVSVTSSTEYATPVQVDITIGEYSTTWTVTTMDEPDTTPDTFSFDDVVDVLPNTEVTSNQVTISGLGEGVEAVLTVTDCSYSINDGAYDNIETTISNGDTLRLRRLASSEWNTLVSAEVTVGTLTVDWDITTVAEDTTPDEFSFLPRNNANLETVYQSNVATISGINSTLNVSITNGEYQINGGSWTSDPGTVSNNDTLRLRGTSSDQFSTPVTVTVDVGEVEKTFVITTKADDTPGNAGDGNLYFRVIVGLGIGVSV